MKKCVSGSLIAILVLCCLAFVPISDVLAGNGPELVGKTYRYDYGDAVYTINFKSEDTLHWVALEGDEKGKSADENYMIMPLDENSAYLAWVEDSGVGVSQIVDFKAGELLCTLFLEEEIVAVTGTIRLVE